MIAPEARDADARYAMVADPAADPAAVRPADPWRGRTVGQR
jgi:hypothetical protein